MKTVIVALAALAVGISPALAKKAKRPRAAAHAAMAQDPYAVYVAGTYVGRDPDPGVRAQMIREFGRRR